MIHPSGLGVRPCSKLREQSDLVRVQGVPSGDTTDRDRRKLVWVYTLAFGKWMVAVICPAGIDLSGYI